MQHSNLNRVDDALVPVESGRYLTAHIPDAKYVELEGSEHYAFIGDVNGLIDEVEEFLTGKRGQPESDRLLATVLFTHIVHSTDRAVELGDRRWHSLLDEHHALVQRELEAFHGREIKTTGDGVLTSTAPRELSDARLLSYAESEVSDWRFEPGCTPVKSK